MTFLAPRRVYWMWRSTKAQEARSNFEGTLLSGRKLNLPRKRLNNVRRKTNERKFTNDTQ